MDRETFRRYGYELIDWLADYMDTVEDYPVRSSVEPGTIREQLPQEAPLTGESMDSLFQDFKDIIMPGMSHWQHPSWFAFFPANNSPPSVLAELLTAGLGAQCMVWETSPAASELEEAVLEWLRKMLGLPQGMAGVIQDTASTATLCALLTAREVATDFMVNESGFQKPLTVYASEETHSSIEKGVKISGYGRENLRYIPTDSQYALIPEELDRAIQKDKQEGRQPACVVATLGTTSSTAMDPLEAIGTICKAHNLWLHVDAAFAGAAAILPEYRHLFCGLEHAHSFVFNPHKWLLTNFDCSAYYVRDPQLLKRTMAIDPAYLQTAHDTQVNNYRDWGIQLGRRFRALKLWFVLRYYGVQGLQNMLRHHIQLAHTFRDWVESHPHFELMAPVPLSLVCFRLHSEGLGLKELNRLNERLLKRVNDRGEVYLTSTTLRDSFVLRLAVGQRTTEKRHVEKAWHFLQEEGHTLLTGKEKDDG